MTHGGKGSDPNRHRYAVAFPGIAHRMAQGRTMPFEQPRAPRPRAGLHRRNLLRGSIVADGLAVPGTAGPAHAQNGARPGLLHARADLDRTRQRVPANRIPWIPGLNRLIVNGHSTSRSTGPSTPSRTARETGRSGTRSPSSTRPSTRSGRNPAATRRFDELDCGTPAYVR
jgi:hypothetical protein